MNGVREYSKYALDVYFPKGQEACKYCRFCRSEGRGTMWCSESGRTIICPDEISEFCNLVKEENHEGQAQNG